MVRKILVPLDGSDVAERALKDATELATATGARVVLVRAVVAHTLPGVDARAPQVEALATADRYLSAAAAQLRGRGVICETATPYGGAAEWIVDEARLRHADLIVMGTRGRTGVDRWVFGSVAESVMASTPVPVMLVRSWLPGLQKLPPGDHPRILVPLDGSAFAETAVTTAAGLADDLGGELVLMRVEPQPEHVLSADDTRVHVYLDQQEETLRAVATDYLTEVQTRQVEDRPSLKVSMRVEFGDPADGITAAAHDADVALIVMSTHGRTGLQRAILGSVAGKVLEHCTTPLVLVRPPALARSASGLTVVRQ